MADTIINAALSGLRVLDLANEYGLYCGKLLAGMGALVIKIEKPGGDNTRNLPPFYQDTPHPENSLFFAYHNTGKKGITLNLETSDGKAIFKKLIESSDVLIETYTAGYLDSLGLDLKSIKQLNPGLVMASITPFGKTGPHKHYCSSSEIIPEAMGGLMFMTGEASTPPLQVGNFLIGNAAGIYATTGILAALLNRDFTGEGQYLDISLQECVASWLEASYARYQYDSAKITTRFGSQLPYMVPSGIFPCKDGYYCVAGTGRWNLIAVWLVDEGFDVGDLIDPKYETMDGIYLVDHRERVNQLMYKLGALYTKKEIMDEGQKREIPITIVGNAQDAYSDKQLNARDFFVDMEHPFIGKLRYPGAPFKMTGSPWNIDKPAPLVGEHNEEIYGSMGYTKDDMVAFKMAGII